MKNPGFIHALFIIISLLVVPKFASAQAGPGHLLTYEGVLTDSADNPITPSANVVFQIVYTDSTETDCVVYEENRIVPTGSKGEFSVVLGEGAYRTDATGNTREQIFAKSGFTCTDHAPSRSGTPRHFLRITVDGNTLSPNIAITNVPFSIQAGNAEKLENKVATDFVQINAGSSLIQSNVESIFNRYTKLDAILNNFNAAGTALGANITGTAANVTGTVAIINGGTGATTQGAAANAILPSQTSHGGQFLTTDGTNVSWALAGSGTVTNVSTGTGLTGGPITNTGTISLANTSVGAGAYGSATQVPNFTVDAQGRLTAASNTSISIPWSAISSGKPTNLTGYGITDAVKNAGGVGNISEGTDASKPGGAIMGDLFVATDSKKMYRYNGSTWEQLADATSIGGITGLSGDVSATGPGGVSATVNNVGGKSATAIATSVNETNSATSASTVSTIVKRDAGGNFAGNNATLNSVVLNDDQGTPNSITLQAPATVTTSYVLNFPNIQGSSNQVMVNDGAGNLSWTNWPTGGVTSVSSGNLDIGVINASTTPVLTLNSGTAGGVGDANKIAKLDASGLLATGMIPDLGVAKLTSGTLPVARGGTNSSTALNNNRVMVSNVGAIVEAPAITGNRALVSDVNGVPTHSAITSTELGYLSGVSSAVQTQINNKASSTGWSAYSVMGVSGAGGLIDIPGSTSGTMLQWSLTGPFWSTATFPNSTTANQLLYSSANNVVGGLATQNNAILTTNGAGVPGWVPLNIDKFTQYALLTGRAGGQVLNGGTSINDHLTLDSTSHSTKGNVLINPLGGKVGIGTSTPAVTLDVAGDVKVNREIVDPTAMGSAGGFSSGNPGSNIGIYWDSSDVSVCGIAPGEYCLNPGTSGLMVMSATANADLYCIKVNSASNGSKLHIINTSGYTTRLMYNATGCPTDSKPIYSKGASIQSFSGVTLIFYGNNWIVVGFNN